MKFIIDICVHAITDGVPYAHTIYSRTTSKVLPTPLLLFSVSFILCLFPGFQWQTFECDTLGLYHPLSYMLQNDHKCRFQQFQGPLNRWIVWLKKFQNTISSITLLTIPSSFKDTCLLANKHQFICSHLLMNDNCVLKFLHSHYPPVQWTLKLQ